MGIPERIELIVREEFDIVSKGKTTSDELMGIVMAEAVLERIKKKIRVITGALFRDVTCSNGSPGCSDQPSEAKS